MLVVVSPAKKLNFTDLADRKLPSTKPAMLSSAEELVTLMRKYDRKKLTKLMKISDKLADENIDRYRQFNTPFKPSNAKQALLAFSGDTYQGLEAGSFSEEDHRYAQDHLRILSGLYGILRPLDLIQAYRLEMGLRLKTGKGNSLYDYWGSDITRNLNKAISKSGSAYLLNCASNEYIAAVQPDALNAEIITPVFKQVKDGEARMLGMMAKRARGALARFVVQNRIDQPEGLKAFRLDGYRYMSKLSDARTLEFHRKA